MHGYSLAYFMSTSPHEVKTDVLITSALCVSYISVSGTNLFVPNLSVLLMQVTITYKKLGIKPVGFILFFTYCLINSYRFKF